MEWRQSSQVTDPFLGTIEELQVLYSLEHHLKRLWGTPWPEGITVLKQDKHTWQDMWKTDHTMDGWNMVHRNFWLLMWYLQIWMDVTNSSPFHKRNIMPQTSITLSSWDSRFVIEPFGRILVVYPQFAHLQKWC